MYKSILLRKGMLFALLSCMAVADVLSASRDSILQANLPSFSVSTIQSDAIFEAHSARFKPNAASYLAQALRMVKSADHSLKIYITSYTDDIMNILNRKKISKAQAESVASYFWSNGIAYERMSIIGDDSEEKLASVHNVNANALNRRVEIVLIPDVFPNQISVVTE